MKNLFLKLRVRLLQSLFTALYYPLAPLYDRISYYAFLGQWPKWQRAAIPRIQGKKVLEIGCGTGMLLIELLRRQYKVVGFDFSRAMLGQARRKLARSGQKYRLVQGRVQALPFPDETFETVLSTFPSEYIVDPLALQEINRVLYPGGRLVIVDAARLKPFNRPAKVLSRLYKVLLGYDSNRSLRELPLPLAESGFLRRDETFEDAQGEAHIIVAIKTW